MEHHGCDVQRCDSQWHWPAIRQEQEKCTQEKEVREHVRIGIRRIFPKSRCRADNRCPCDAVREWHTEISKEAVRQCEEPHRDERIKRLHKVERTDVAAEEAVEPRAYEFIEQMMNAEEFRPMLRSFDGHGEGHAVPVVVLR